MSSAPLGELEDPQTEKEGDKIVSTYDSHEDSVLGIRCRLSPLLLQRRTPPTPWMSGTAWSCYDAWVFASLSYDGRVVMNHVPSTEKYKILL